MYKTFRSTSYVYDGAVYGQKKLGEMKIKEANTISREKGEVDRREDGGR